MPVGGILLIKNKEELIEQGNNEIRKDCLNIIEYALKSVNPRKELKDHINITSEQINIFENTFRKDEIENIYILGAGKASYSMGKEIESKFKDLINDGVIVTKYGYKKENLNRIKVIEAGHPIPDKKSIKAGKELLKLAEKGNRNDLIINLISGGGSALAVLPSNSINISEIQKTSELLLSQGADIEEINTIREHISDIKGGNLTKSINPANSISLIVSDVVGDKLDTIASGLTAPDNTTYNEAYNILNKYQILEKIPKNIKNHLIKGKKGKIKETPKEKDFENFKQKNIIISSNDKATEKAKTKAKKLGYNTLILSRMIEGESLEAGKFIAGITNDIKRTNTPIKKPATLISGGETTVTTKNTKGKGGPNQEFVIGAATKINKQKNITIASIDTDGTDGPTNIAGGIVDENTTKRIKQKNIALQKIIKNHNTKKALKKIKSTIKTGPTGTNVNDLRIAIIK